MLIDTLLDKSTAYPTLSTICLVTLSVNTVTEQSLDTNGLDGYLTGLSLIDTTGLDEEQLRWIFDPVRGEAKPAFPAHLQKLIASEIKDYAARYLAVIQDSGSPLESIEQRIAIGLPANLDAWLYGFSLAVDKYVREHQWWNSKLLSTRLQLIESLCLDKDNYALLTASKNVAAINSLLRELRSHFYLGTMQ